MKTLVIDEESIFKVKVEARETFSSSFFSDIYTKADKILKEISDNSDKNVSGEINNIIAFVGERGAGKTSVMISFANSLEKYKYDVLKTIDPSVFSKSDSIIEVIVAEMFKKFKDFRNNCDEVQTKRQDLMKLFEKVYRGLRILNSNKSDIYKEHEDDLEVLIDLTSGISLKLQLEKLIEQYLEYIGKDVLVIPIDDLDMNISNGDKMLEDIRKYLLIHNVVVLMAVKIEQMKNSVQQKYITDFKGIIDNNKNKKEADKEAEINIKFMANKYLEKIIPVERRLVLPKLNESDAKITIKINKPYIEVENIRDLIKTKLFEKLNIIMIFDDQNDKLIPQTLRGIIDLIKILFSMENIDEGSDEFSLRKINGAKLKSNINIFKNYILSDWCDENIKYNHYEFLKEVDEIKPELVNRRIVHHLGGKIIKNLTEDKSNNKKNDKEKDIESELLTYAKTISDREVNYENISIGEVNTCIYAYDKITFKEETKRFILALKMLYTLKLLKLRYCEKDGEKRIRDVFAGDLFGEYFNISKNIYKNKFKVPLKVYNSSLKIKLNKQDVIGIANFRDNVGNNNELIEDSDFMYLGINKIIENLDTLNKQEELTYLYSLIVPQFSRYLGNLFQSEKYYEYRILGVSSYYSNFYFKPLNIISTYIYLDDIRNRVVNANGEFDNEEGVIKSKKSMTNDRLKKFIIELVINQDLFMKITDKLDEELNKAKYTNTPIEIINNIIKKFKLSIKICLDNGYKGTDELDIINKYGEFINENIKIIERINSGYLGYYQEEKMEINHVVPSTKVRINVDEDMYSILEKISDIQEYLKKEALDNKGASVNDYINKKVKLIEKTLNSNEQLKDIKNIYYKYKKIIRDTRLKISKTDSYMSARRQNVSALSNIMNELKEKMEKGA